jgi:hypothetical protein
MQGNIGKATFQPTDLTVQIIDHTCPEGGAFAQPIYIYKDPKSSNYNIVKFTSSI